jgi:MFS family permease
MGIVGLPITWFGLKRHRPEYYGLLPDGAKAREHEDASQLVGRGIEYAAEVEEVEFTLRQAMKTPAFWLLILAYASHSLAMPTINIHSIPLLTDMGIAPLRAAGMMATMVFASIPARLIGGILADRVAKKHLRFLMAGLFLLQAIGIAVFLLNQTVSMIYVWFILYGIGMGASLTLNTPMRARYFGRKAFGSIHGTSMMLITPAGVAAPIYAGWTYDTTGSYLTVFTLLAALLTFSAFLMCFVIPPKPPSQVTGIRKII